tara:strand:- start:2849 stop:3055 length:207 start_codon:yes stop_codon:yes gene_type:complete
MERGFIHYRGFRDFYCDCWRSVTDWWSEQEAEADRIRRLLGDDEEDGPDPQRFLTGQKNGRMERKNYE